MQTAFEPSACHLLLINSKKSDEGGGGGGVSEYWFGFTHRFHNVEVRKGGGYVASGAGVYSAAVTASDATETRSDEGFGDHPLADVNHASDSPPPHQPQAKLTQASIEKITKQQQKRKFL